MTLQGLNSLIKTFISSIRKAMKLNSIWIAQINGEMVLFELCLPSASIDHISSTAKQAQKGFRCNRAKKSVI